LKTITTSSIMQIVNIHLTRSQLFCDVVWEEK